MSNQIKAANFYILVALFLSGCAGSGVKDVSQFMPLIESNEESAVLVVRQTGFQGSGALVEVVVDGFVVGDLGNTECCSQDSPWRPLGAGQIQRYRWAGTE